GGQGEGGRRVGPSPSRRGEGDLMAGVLVFAEQRDERFKKPALEAISEGRRLADKTGGDLTVLLVGGDLAGLDAEPKRLGADRILLVKDPRLTLYAPEAYAKALETSARHADPDLLLMAASPLPPPL